jgi:hypothetical protein
MIHVAVATAAPNTPATAVATAIRMTMNQIIVIEPIRR